ncbi:CRISPR-associated endonuclease Cas3'' [Oxalobacter formigenes]|uniref:CRISPR-associated endonuclease Cas3'' n=1 Tax=Oxalobacter formigenes TaxID=847 RepID=UPI00241CF58B|nr:CRISPR-associated endonuclease Cas3'' [Oxalobacter formigenes]
MIVTFVSQCEKKALPRTRRVLDAFANRIGNNTWQTVITEDGLIAVKKLLRKTVTKNTAVSCHWIRSRRRSELLWIVGNRQKFNSEGIVPVNSTQKDVFMDITTMKPKQNEFYANTHLQPLALHSFAVGYIARKLLEQAVNDDDYGQLANIAFLAGILHDLGKLELQFQGWVKKGKQKEPDDDGQHIDNSTFSFDKHPRHNEISLFLFNLFENQCKGINNPLKTALQHVIYWHHAKPWRQNDQFTGVVKAYDILLKNISREKIEELAQTTLQLLKRIHHIAQHYDESLNQIEKNLPWSMEFFNTQIEDFCYQKNGTPFPEFKTYMSPDFERLRLNIATNAQHNILRACVISADRLISSLSTNDLSDYISQNRLDELLENMQEESTDLSSHLADALTRFPDSERTRKQGEVVRKLAEIDDIAVLAGAAGCGKTKIALEWAKLNNAQKIIWVCPRVQVCQGIFEELTTQYMPEAKIEIFTGEFKYTHSWEKPTPEKDYFSGDIIVTTIDQILGSIVTHTKVNSLLPFMNAHVVFDEYHEYIGMEIFNLLFAELVANKKMRSKGNKNTLLVSATPHYLYLEKVLDIDTTYDAVEMPSFNPSQYKIEFVEFDESDKLNSPFYQAYADNTFIISNTAQTAQLGFIYRQKTEKSVLFHSKFKRSDKKYWFNEVYESFRKNGTRKFDVLRSGPIVQASLNISCDHMVSEMSHPENILQRLGRLDRFGDNTDINVLKIAITDNIKRGKQTDSSARFLAKLHGLRSTKVWYEYLSDKLDDRIFTLPEIYQLYKAFYDDETIRSIISQDLDDALNSSIQLINKKVTEPTRVIKIKTAERKTKISKNSLRGDNRFVQLAQLDVNDFNHPVFINEYAYQPPLNDSNEADNLTESLSFIQNLGLFDFIAQKHGNIDTIHPVKGIPEKKMSARKTVLENYSRDPDYPLYLSYIEDDLNKVGGSSARHSEAVYYAICDKQPVGAIGLKTISTLNPNQTEE